jgi:hypothetical protein
MEVIALLVFVGIAGAIYWNKRKRDQGKTYADPIPGDKGPRSDGGSQERK